MGTVRFPDRKIVPGGATMITPYTINSAEVAACAQKCGSLRRPERLQTCCGSL